MSSCCLSISQIKLDITAQLLHIGSRMLRPPTVCVVKRWNFLLIIENTYVEGRWSFVRIRLVSSRLQQHCRNCGYIVCEGCSKKRFLLPHLDAKPVRVCDSCYTKLNENGSPRKYHAAFLPRFFHLSLSFVAMRSSQRDSSDSDGDDSSGQVSGPSVCQTTRSSTSSPSTHRSVCAFRRRSIKILRISKN